jgi:hypothetical protein
MSTEAQVWKYRAEWSKAWKALRAAGHYAGEKADDVRKRWHLYIGAVYLRGPEAGQPKSSTRLTNRELDAFFKRCAAAHSAADFARQIELDDQPLHRLRFATDPLLDLVKMAESAREAYLGGIYANVQRKRVREGARELPIAEMPDADLQLVVIALTHTVMHKLGAAHDHPHTGRGTRAAYDHQVGDRRNVTGASAPRPAQPTDEWTVPEGVDF